MNSSNKENVFPKIYTKEEINSIEKYIQQHFGKFENVFHEIISPDIHVDICIVPPCKNRDFYILVTMGMGAHRMNVPNNLSKYNLERAELVIALPKSWSLNQDDLQNEKWYWPIRLLKDLARLPITNDTWLGFGHTIDNGEYFSNDTKLCAAILTEIQCLKEEYTKCTLLNGEEVNFYQVIPLYGNELEYKMEYGANMLLEKIKGIGSIVNPTRQNAIIKDTFSSDDEDDYINEMDDANWHIESIRKKELPVDEINAYNHMAIYLRWCIEHDLMSQAFLQEYKEIIQKVQIDSPNIDLRVFIQNELDGQLFSSIFNQIGKNFADYYYGENESPYFPSDIDNYAIDLIGEERNYSDEIQDEAYLFVPFNEKYYQDMAEVIKKRFTNWQGQFFDESTKEPSSLAIAMMKYLNCECIYFPSMKDDDPITSEYSYCKKDSNHEGFIPMLITVDESLWECLIINSDPNSDSNDDYTFDLDKVTKYRQKMLTTPIRNGKEVLAEHINLRKEESDEDDIDWKNEVLGEIKGGFENNSFVSYWNYETNMTYPLILAKIPVNKPWEVFAYLPFGGWNECPDTLELMAIAKYWFEQHGAVSAVMTHDVLEFDLQKPVTKDKAMDTALEMYGFCPDVVDQGPENATVGSLADTLNKSKVWYFWWD